MTGFVVDEDELRAYAGKLVEQKGVSSNIAGLVDQADVGDQSWGVVGIFVKDQYTQTLADLKELFTDLQEGLQSASDKFSGAAANYRRHEDSVTELLNTLDFTVES